MGYTEITPHQFLQDYIDAYWRVTGCGLPLVQRIMPDGCVDIIVDLYGDEKPNLVGTMTHFKMIEVNAEAQVLGIRFKPAAFAAFFKFAAMDQVTNLSVELDATFSFDLKKLLVDAGGYLDQFFLERLRRPSHLLFPVIGEIERHRGQISVSRLSELHAITERQLERNFKQYVGIGPKAFINFVRYKNVVPAIRNRPDGRSLLDIAYAHGFYDHSHLTNEIKRYSGLLPSEI